MKDVVASFVNCCSNRQRTHTVRSWSACVVAVGTLCFGLALLTTGVSAAEGTTVVNWALSPNYVTENYHFTPSSASSIVDGTALIYPYDPLTLRPQASPSYTPPAGTTGYFHTGAWIDDTTDSVRSTFNHRIFNHASGDRISFITGSVASHEGLAVFGAIFVSFLQDGFLNGGNAGTVQFGLDGEGNPVGSLSMSYLGAADANVVRFAILNDGQWYVSEATRTTNGTFSITNENILTSTWGEWSPTGGSGGRLDAAPTEFLTLGSEFLNIQGFGYFIEFNGAFGQQVSADVTSFVATALIIPEPSTYAAGLGLVVLLAVALRRRRK